MDCGLGREWFCWFPLLPLPTPGCRQPLTSPPHPFPLQRFCGGWPGAAPAVLAGPSWAILVGKARELPQLPLLVGRQDPGSCRAGSTCCPWPDPCQEWFSRQWRISFLELDSERKDRDSHTRGLINTAQGVWKSDRFPSHTRSVNFCNNNSQQRLFNSSFVIGTVQSFSACIILYNPYGHIRWVSRMRK